ncbi:hypothetical protein [Corynebacterium caspium]|uniref:hypothetical protein n=1 Tax=Corynebacterium caspium TaxID=234828 RepID=UPI0003810416|nr:hypothetical protein [Corynebacterium caspium]WKD59410.1 hypothetical protein CCASP_05110 [Corynebacterium caspium DSM 44850]
MAKWKIIAAFTGVTLLSSLALACGTNSAEQQEKDFQIVKERNKKDKARSENTLRTVDPGFGDKPQVLANDSGSGVQTAQLFFDKSDILIVTGSSVAEQLRGASLAVVAYAPALKWSPETQSEIENEVQRLGVRKILLVGKVQLPKTLSHTEIEIIRDNGSANALSDLTSLSFDKVTVENPSELAKAISKLDPKNPAELSASWEKLPYGLTDGEKLQLEGSITVASVRDGGTAPIVIASPQSSIMDIANAKAFGAPLRFMDYPDPRWNEETRLMVTGLANKPLIALGSAFGTAEHLIQAITLSENTEKEINGGGQLVFPGRRMIALYGHPSGPALGLLGSMPPAAAVEYTKEIISQFSPLETEQTLMPAFEIITTVAASQPGPEQKYTNYTDPADLQPYIEAITTAGGYAVLDLQPGRESFINQAKRYAELLKNPNVGLALDPEWNIGPEEKPLQRVGSAEAAEINEVATWLAKLTAENKLPQKLFIVHQFQLQMLRDRDQINTDIPELAFVLHVDGHGTPSQKLDTWNAIRAGLSPNWFMAWKNFTKEDMPMFGPEESFGISPRPWFISYQ